MWRSILVEGAVCFVLQGGASPRPEAFDLGCSSRKQKNQWCRVDHATSRGVNLSYFCVLTPDSASLHRWFSTYIRAVLDSALRLLHPAIWGLHNALQ